MRDSGHGGLVLLHKLGRQQQVHRERVAGGRDLQYSSDKVLKHDRVSTFTRQSRP